jgi:hypothetical protein
MSAFGLFDGKSLFDFDGDGSLNFLEQNEYELFVFGDGSMHEPSGVSTQSAANYTYFDDDEDSADFNDDSDEEENETIELIWEAEPRQPNKPIVLTDEEKKVLKEQRANTDIIAESLIP